MKKLKESYVSVFVLVLLFSILGSLNFAFADTTTNNQTTNRKAISNIVTGITMTRNDGSELGTIDQWTDILVTMDFTLPNNEIVAGDTSIISLPKELELQKDSTFEVKDEAGNIVAIASANAADKTVTLTYTDYAETHSNIKGNLWFSVQVDSYTVTENGKIPLEFDIEGQTIVEEIDYEKGTGDQEEVLYKAGEINPADPQVIHYSLRVNVSSKDLTDAVVSDLLAQQQDITIDPASIKVNEIDYTWNGEDWDIVPNSTHDVTAAFQDKIVLSEQNKGFSIRLGDINRPYLITYDGVIGHLPTQGESFDNKATLTANEIETTTSEKTIVYSDQGGNAGGNTYQIHLTKKDKETAALLDGATFDVVRVSTNRKVGSIQIVNGEGQITGLLQDSYQLIETKAPAGYVLDQTPILVKPEDFKETNQIAIANIVATNEREKTELNGNKVWDDQENKFQTRPASITIILLQNGQTFQTKEVKADSQGNWHFHFTDLPKYDTAGNAYAYTLNEIKVDKYETTVAGTTITNKLTDIPEVPSKPEVPNKPVVPEKKPTHHVDSLPNTGEKETSLWLLAGSLLLVGAYLSFSKKQVK